MNAATYWAKDWLVMFGMGVDWIHSVSHSNGDELLVLRCLLISISKLGL